MRQQTGLNVYSPPTVHPQNGNGRVPPYGHAGERSEVQRAPRGVHGVGQTLKHAHTLGDAREPREHALL
jgi:hypothetical protein